MRRRGVTQTVDRFYNGAQRSEETDSVVSAFDVVVDSARQTDAREAHFGQTHCTHVGTVTADNHQRVDTTFFRFSIATARMFSSRNSGKRAEPRNVPPRLIMSETRCNGLAVPYGLHTDPDSRHKCPLLPDLLSAQNEQPANCGVHARRITAACQHTDFLNHDYL